MELCMSGPCLEYIQFHFYKKNGWSHIQRNYIIEVQMIAIIIGKPE